MSEVIEAKILRRRIENIGSLPTVPETLRKLSRIMEKQNVSLTEIAGFVQSDPALTFRILKMVNSAVYGFPGRIASVSHAIMLLGLNVVKGLLLGVSVFELMQKAMTGLYEHSMGCAAAARIIAQKKGLREPEEAYVAGLIHDIGKVVMALEFTKAYEAALASADAEHISISQAEKKFFAENHPALGGYLAERWRFPKKLSEAILYHHQPRSAVLFPLETAIVHVADILTKARGLGFSGDQVVPIVDDAAFDRLALSEQDIIDVFQELEGSIEATQEVLL
ncbi:MAG TPA: HDOD domain-containing protein [Syntrophales bacterium]|nr:HDOD domain-containing protein [Syntrophales bacterium]